jgi:hypothetical protein
MCGHVGNVPIQSFSQKETAQRFICHILPSFKLDFTNFHGFSHDFLGVSVLNQPPRWRLQGLSGHQDRGLEIHGLWLRCLATADGSHGSHGPNRNSMVFTYEKWIKMVIFHGYV